MICPGRRSQYQQVARVRDMECGFPTYRLIRLGGLAQPGIGRVDLLDHTGQIPAHVLQPLSQSLRQLVRPLALLIRAGQLHARTRPVLGQHLIYFALVLAQPTLQLVLLVLNRAQLHLHAGGLLFRRDGGDVELADLGHVFHEELIPVSNRLGLRLEFFGVFG